MSALQVILGFAEGVDELLPQLSSGLGNKMEHVLEQNMFRGEFAQQNGKLGATERLGYPPTGCLVKLIQPSSPRSKSPDSSPTKHEKNETTQTKSHAKSSEAIIE